MSAGRKVLRLVPTLAVTVASVTVLALAINAVGQRVERVDANNAALWVTSNQDDRYGRFNKASSTIELANRPGEAIAMGNLDVAQDGNTLLVRDDAAGKLIPVDTASGLNGIEASIGLASGTKLDLRGGTLAILDPASGKLWAKRTDGSQGQVDLSGFDPTSAPLTDLGPVSEVGDSAAALSVGADGSIHAASTNGKSVVIAATESGFGQPAFGDVPTGQKAIQIAALGDGSAIFFPVTGGLILPGGKTVQLPADEQSELQAGGAKSDRVAVATSTTLFSVGYDGVITTISTAGNGAPAVPVALEASSCVFGSWAGSPGRVARSCNGAPAVELEMDRDDPGLYDPVFRVNWGLVVLNDRENGRIFDVDLRKSLDDWKAFESERQDDKDKLDKDSARPTEAKPKAEDDSYGARPERTSVLHVLDNDADPNGRVLSITGLTQPRNGATVMVSPDGQTVQYQQPEDGRNGSFEYTISNGVATATASVQVQAENGNENHPPQPRPHYQEPTFAAAPAGTVSMPVAGDFRDFDGDPITLVGAADGTDDVPVTTDGQIEYTAPSGKAKQTRTVRFEVTDGNSPAQSYSSRVKVAGTDDTEGIAPIAQPDAAVGEVGKPLSILPLANDIAGVDPGDEETHLTLAAEVEGWKGAKVTTDKDSGRITVVAKTKGTHYLKYKVAFGSAPGAESIIRVDVRDSVGDKPIAMPDQGVIRGQQAITLDVLANDSDPHGGLLTVQTAAAADPDSLEVAVVRGRWLRLVPQTSDLKPNPLSVAYQVINGEGSLATGSVVVTRLPALAEDAPLVRGDTGTVRAGDSTLIPVLANDFTLGGTTLTLATKVGEAATGELPVSDPTKDADEDQGDVGKAFVSGGQVRYVAPKSVAATQDVTIDYVAQAGKRKATGQITMTVNPGPDAENPDSPPEPTSIEARATAGDTVTIPVPAAAQDPDGDSVALVGLASGPKLGRVISLSPKGITYQAFPTEDGQGTDTFGYVVSDRYGEVGTGTVRVAVVPPGQTQLPIPVDDQLVAKPGAVVQLDVIANDLIAMSDEVSVLPLQDPPAGVSLAGPQGPIVATVPADGAEPLMLQYQLSGNGGKGPQGTVRIEGRTGALNPPHLQDQVAVLAPDARTASVDVLANAWDADGTATGLRVTSTSEPTATTVGGQVTVPVLPRPQVISYEVADADGATAAALIYVPPSGDGLPFAHGTIPLDSSTKTVNLADYITSPRGHQIRITLADTVSVAPSSHLKVKPAKDLTSVELSVDDYVGPATLNLEVTDGDSLTDPEGRVATVSLPIQVGPDTPVLRCPTEPQEIVRGTTGKSMDLLSLCHVWTADPATRDSLAFTANWKETVGIANVTPLIEGQSLVLQANGEAKPGDQAEVRVEIPGTKAIPGILTVVVKDARKPRYKPQTVEVKQGETVTGTIELDSPIEVGRKDVILAMPHLAGGAESFVPGTADWSVTADPEFFGPLAYDLTLSDVANAEVLDRQIQGTLTVSVYGIPAAPAAPSSGKNAQNHAVTLTWKTPDNHGATIEKYEVKREDDGRTWPCDTNSCTIKPLQNDVPVQFRVRAFNKAGWSEWGELSPVFRPDRVPDVVTGFTASDPQDHRITLNWNAVASSDFSAVTRYDITWPGGSTSVGGGATSTTISGLANQDTTFAIWARNRTGKSRKAARTKGWPTGKPTAFSVESVTADLDVDSPVATVTWSRSEPNGKGPVTYQVLDGGDVVCAKVSGLSCHVGRTTLDGSSHTFEVVATNYYDFATSASKSWKAIGSPAKWSGDLDLQATGTDQEFSLSTTTPNSRGSSATLKVDAGGNVTTREVDPSGEDVDIELSTPANGRDYTVKLTLCNEDFSMGCSITSGTVNTYGKLSRPSISASSSYRTASFQVSGVSGNGRAATLVVTSSKGYSRSFDVPATGSASFSGSQDVGWSTAVTFTAQLKPKSGQSRSDSPTDSARVTTRAKPNPVATFSLGEPSSARDGWWVAYLKLSDWNPNSTVHCEVTANSPGLFNWSVDIKVDSSGNWGATKPPGNLIVHTASDLPTGDSCTQR